jgi:hypothetical protein
VSWLLYSELAAAGVHVAFADTDQLCMCYPAPPGDPGHQRLRALNVGAVIPNFRSAGAQCVIVNGVLDPDGLEPGLLPDTDVTICRLRADYDVVEHRFAAKHGERDDMSELLREVKDDVGLMDASSLADACVDTTRVPAGEVAGMQPGGDLAELPSGGRDPSRRDGFGRRPSRLAGLRR